MPRFLKSAAQAVWRATWAVSRWVIDLTDWIGKQLHVSSQWASRAGFIVLFGLAMTFVQVDEYGLALAFWIAASIVLLSKAIHWKGIDGRVWATRIGRLVYAFAAIALIPISVIWIIAKRGEKPWTAFMQRSPLVATSTTGQPGTQSSKHFVTIKDLFNSDWSFLPGYYMESAIILSGRKIPFAWTLYGDFKARSKFLVIFFEDGVQPADVFSTCSFAADNYSFFNDSMDSTVDIVGKAPDDASVTHFNDMVFSKRIFVYYDDPDLSLAMKGKLDTVYASKGLSIVFRDSQYVAAHQDNHPKIVNEKRVSNSFILPNPAPPKGWLMKVINKAPAPMPAPKKPNFAYLAPGVWLNSDTWDFLITRRGPDPIFNAEVLFIDAVRQQQIRGRASITEADINSFQKIVRFPELDAHGLGSAFATQFLWKPFVPDHQHYYITITWRDGSVSEDLAIERIDSKWLWAMTVKDRASGGMLAECEDPGFPLGTALP